MSQSLAKDFNFRSLLKFAFPSIIMMIFMSLYSIVDGFFIAQYVDSMALSAANIVYPAVSILLAVGIMFGTGGSAVVAAKIGQGKLEEANRNFSALTLTTLIIGILGAVLGNLFCRQICSLLGATPVLMDYGTAYLRTILFFAPVCLLQALFQSFFVTAGARDSDFPLRCPPALPTCFWTICLSFRSILVLRERPLPPALASVSRPLPVFYTLPLPEKAFVSPGRNFPKACSPQAASTVPPRWSAIFLQPLSLTFSTC